METSKRFIVAELALATVAVSAAVVGTVQFYNLSHTIDRIHEKTTCRSVALRSVDYGVPSRYVSEVRSACDEVVRN